MGGGFWSANDPLPSTFLVLDDFLTSATYKEKVANIVAGLVWRSCKNTQLLINLVIKALIK